MNKYLPITLLDLFLLATACSVPAASNTNSNSTDAPQSQTSGNQLSISTTDSESSASFTKLNLYTVTGDELLVAIPGFSNRMTREFQEYRPYVSIQQFRREIGKYVGYEQVAEYEKYVYVPIAINKSDAETLMQIPGPESAEADTLNSSRPFASTGDFLVKLNELVSTDEFDIGKSYLGEN